MAEIEKIEVSQNTGKIEEEYREGFVKNAQGKWVFVKGRKKTGGIVIGNKQFKTIFFEKFGQKGRDEIIQVIYESARRGDYNFCKEILNRLFGETTKPVEVEFKKKMVLLDE